MRLQLQPFPQDDQQYWHNIIPFSPVLHVGITTPKQRQPCDVPLLEKVDQTLLEIIAFLGVMIPVNQCMTDDFRVEPYLTYPFLVLLEFVEKLEPVGIH